MPFTLDMLCHPTALVLCSGKLLSHTTLTRSGKVKFLEGNRKPAEPNKDSYCHPEDLNNAMLADTSSKENISIRKENNETPITQSAYESI